MKKIVGILAAAAVLATSVFAADIAAATKINGNVLEYANETFSLFKEGNDSHSYAQPNLALSISDEKAGASVKLTSDGGTKEVKLAEQTIWFKPVDVLKVTLGNYDVALNKEQIKYTQSVTGLGGNGLLLSLNVSGFGLDLGFSANEAYWLAAASSGDPAIAQFFVKAGYSADFGTIAAYAEFNRAKTGRRTYAYHDKFFGAEKSTTSKEWVIDQKTGKPTEKDKTTKTYGSKYDLMNGAIGDIHFGAGYGNNFNGINVFLNVAGFMGKNFEWIRPEAYIGGNVDAFGYKAFLAPLIYTGPAKPSTPVELEVVVDLSYKLEPCTIFLTFLDEDVIANKFVSTTSIGASGSVGLATWKVWAEIKTTGIDKAPVSIAVPFEFTANF